ncbi:hypothetical protein BH10ACT10_BH10ACT10_28110 [soil metagenome]
MPITETPAPIVSVPRQAGPIVGPLDHRVADRVPAVVDHVRLHGVRCYWDLRQCRWECRPD